MRNNPLRYIDPTGHQEEEPPPGISEEEHERLLALHAEAQRLRDLIQQGTLTDVEALAMLLEYAIELNTHQVPWGEDVAWGDTISDLGLVLGGIRFIIGQSSRGDWFFEQTHREDHELNMYYCGGFSATGFHSQFFDSETENQVRHFVGGMVGAHTPLDVGEIHLRGREDRDSGDYRLNEMAFELEANLSSIHSDEGVSNWVYRNIANQEVQSRHAIREPEGPCLGSFLPAYVIVVAIVAFLSCSIMMRKKKKRKGGHKYGTAQM